MENPKYLSFVESKVIDEYGVRDDTVVVVAPKLPSSLAINSIKNWE